MIKPKVAIKTMQRVNVIGTSGRGKSTFSRKLAALLKAPYLEIDKLYWGPNWNEPADELFFKKLEAELNRESWVLDGNYQRTEAIKWKNVQVVIWLDYSMPRVMFRVIKRALWRIISQAEIWEGTGNRETLKMLFSRDSIVLWSFNTYHSNKSRYNETMHNIKYAHIKFIRISSPAEALNFLDEIANSSNTKD